MKVIISLIALLYSAVAWGNDGDTFVAKSSEGVDITFMVVSEAEKTCKVGVGVEGKPAIDINQGGIITIPTSVNGYSVVSIGSFAFQFCHIEEFHLPNTIKIIEQYAFYFNKNLKEIDIPKSVQTIERGAFIDCENLAHVSFHEGLKRINANAFTNSGLTSIEFPSSLEYLDGWSFTRIPHLSTVTVHSSTPIPHTNRTIFSSDTYLRAVLYVPQGTTNTFKADNEWGAFRNIKEGEPLFERPSDIAYPTDFGRQYVVYGNPVTVNVNFINERTTPVSTISYVPIIDGAIGEEQTYKFPIPIAANGEPFTLQVTLPDFDNPKTKDILIDITKMNGVAVNYGADIRPNTSGTAAVFIPVTDHRIMIRDFTSPRCLWAPRSNIGFEKLKEKYGDKVIRASFHVTEPMWCEPYRYTPITPACDVDGYFVVDLQNFQYVDPYYGEGSSPLGIIDLVDKYITQPHLGNVKILSAQWADADQTEINVVTEATLGMSDFQTGNNASYCFEYMLVEDGLKGEGPEWEQLNGYAGMTTDDPYLQPLTQLPYTITNMVYNEVVVGEGMNGCFQSFTYGVPLQQTYTLKLSELTKSIIQDKNRLRIVVCFEDLSNSESPYSGLPIDSYKSSITAHPSGVQSIKQSATSYDIYDLSGRKMKSAATTLDNLPKGVYIYGGKKVVIGGK